MNWIKLQQQFINFFSYGFPICNIFWLYLFSYEITISKYEEDILSFMLFFTLMDVSLQFLIYYHYIYIVMMFSCGIFFTHTLYSYFKHAFWLDIYFMVYVAFCIYKFTFLKIKYYLDDKSIENNGNN